MNLQTLFSHHKLFGRSKPTIFFAHHKCATTWLGAYLQALSSKNGLTYGYTHLSETIPPGDVLLFANSSYSFARQNKLKGCHILRNPLSVLTSAYFSHLQTHRTKGWPELETQRTVLRSVDRTAGFYLTLAFLERADFHSGAIGPLCGLRTWNYCDPSYLNLRMEDAVRHPTKTVRQALAFIGIDVPSLPDEQDFSFEIFSAGRKPGEVDESSHYRSGSADDWRQYLPAAIVAYVRAHFRPMLERFYPEVL